MMVASHPRMKINNKKNRRTADDDKEQEDDQDDDVDKDDPYWKTLDASDDEESRSTEIAFSAGLPDYGDSTI